MKIKLKGITGINWLFYTKWCEEFGLQKTNFKNLKMFTEGTKPYLDVPTPKLIFRR